MSEDNNNSVDTQVVNGWDVLNMYPIIARLAIDGKNKIDIKDGKVWLHYITMDISVPHSDTASDIVEYITNRLDDMEAVPFENLAHNEEYIGAANEALEKFKAQIKHQIGENDYRVVVDTPEVMLKLELLISP